MHTFRISSIVPEKGRSVLVIVTRAEFAKYTCVGAGIDLEVKCATS